MFRYAVCNELFEGVEHARACDYAASLGYAGLEIAPFTLAPLITDASAETLARTRREAESAGLAVTGLHWLLAKTAGFHLTSPDPDLQAHTGRYLGELARACGELGGAVLVLGSPLQRSLLPGVTREQALGHALATLGHCLPALGAAGVTLALEPLGRAETNFLTTAAEATELVRQVGHPRVRLILDVKAMSDEATPAPELIRAHAPDLAHFHANDPNRRGPGFGAADFRPILAALAEVNYAGFVSVEVFDFSPDSETIARESIRYLKSCEPS